MNIKSLVTWTALGLQISPMLTDGILQFWSMTHLKECICEARLVRKSRRPETGKNGWHKHARFKHARFQSAVTPGLIPLTSMGTGPMPSTVNNQNKACGSSPTEHFILKQERLDGLCQGETPSYSQAHAAEMCWSEPWCAQRGCQHHSTAPAPTRLILPSTVSCSSSSEVLQDE